MFKYKIVFILSIILFIFACKSGKEGINLEEETDETILAKGNAALESGKYDKAIELYNILLMNFPTSDLHISAQLNIAKAMGGKEEYEEQLDLLLRILKENTIPDRVPEILVQIGDFYVEAAKWNPGNETTDTTDWKKAAIYYRKGAFYPDSDDYENKAKALYLAGVMYARQKQLDMAQRAYEGVVSNYSQSPYSQLSKLKLADPANTEILTPKFLAEVGGGEGEAPPPEGEQSFDQLLDEKQAETQDQEIQDMIMDTEADSLRKETQDKEYFETLEDTARSDQQEFFEQEPSDTTSLFE